MNISGEVKKIFDSVKVSENFTKQDIVIQYDTHTQYPKEVLLTCSGKTLDYSKDLDIGDIIDADFNLSTRPSKDGKFFGNSCNVYKISRKESRGKQKSQPAQNAVSDVDDLPF